MVLLKKGEIDMLSTDRVYRLCNEKRYFTSGTNDQYTEMFKMVYDDKPIHDIALVIWICSKGYTFEEIEQSLKDIDHEQVVCDIWNKAYDIFTDGERTEGARCNDMQKYLWDQVKEGTIDENEKFRMVREIMECCDPCQDLYEEDYL